MRTLPIAESAPTPDGASCCQSCASVDLLYFHEAGTLPVNSCLLLDTPEAARHYPRGELSLAFCRACGFVGNIRFDSAMTRYTSGYEEQQSFSPRFNEFAEGLAQRWIDRYNLRNKTVLEIGCGKGDFLSLLCQLGSNRGIGIDPSYVPGRNEDTTRVRFIVDFYSERYANLVVDAVCCRHTLEHIPNPAAFMRTVRRALGDRLHTLVLFELPDVGRVLKECAFWDIYYEHCSYFSLGSLARLFRRTGFEVLDLMKDYDDQYLLIEAKPTAADCGSPLPQEDDLTDLAASVVNFRQSYQQKVHYWRQRLAELRAQGRRVAIWGSGSKCVAFLSTLGASEEVGEIVDINPYRHGKFLPGSAREIRPPTVLRDYQPDVVIAMNPVYLDEIRRDLNGMNLRPELTALY